MEIYLTYAFVIGFYFVPWKRFPRARYVFWGIFGMAALGWAHSV